jgi:hypothetical protein
MIARHISVKKSKLMNTGKIAVIQIIAASPFIHTLVFLATNQFNRAVIGKAKIPNNIAPSPTNEPVPLVAMIIPKIKISWNTNGMSIEASIFINALV